jgi:preprotein translocase subunit SecB
MSTPGNGGPAQSPAGAQAQTQPQLNVLGQYIKDFSFENPNAPRSLAPNQTQPAIQIQINVGVQQLAETDYEISLKLDGKADSAGTVLFAFDLTFAGVFRIQNIPKESLQPVVMIECPRLLFPFAREIVATAVRNGGFPPLLLDPVDFVSLYQQRMAQMQPGQATTTPGTGGG